MPSVTEGSLVAVCLPRPEAAQAVREAWDRGQAVLPLDPGAPAAALQAALDGLRPTELVDAHGRRHVAGGQPVSPEVAAVVATSGTTGVPKGVELTWGGLHSGAAAVSAALDVGPGDRWLCCLPLHHVAGLAVVARAWSTKTPLVVTPGFDPAAVAEASATLVSVVPTMLARLLDAGVDTSRFHRVLLGGTAPPPALVARAESAGAALVVTYGLTETWGGVVFDGHPLPAVEVRLGEGSPGEVELRAPMVMRGYRLRPAETAAAFTADGWLRTGDVGVVGGDGRLTVVDRLRDVVITGGVTVAPGEVEAVLARHPQVADVCVTGAADEEWGERVVAHVVPCRPDRPPTLAELRDFARRYLGATKLPRALVLVDAIPRSPAGKPLRRLLRA